MSLITSDSIINPYYPGTLITVGSDKISHYGRYSLEENELNHLVKAGEFQSNTVPWAPETIIYISAKLTKDEADKRFDRGGAEAQNLRSIAIKEKRLSALATTSLLAFIPPAILLFIGWSLLWAMRGFKQA